jgi:hypothetical protein
VPDMPDKLADVEVWLNPRDPGPFATITERLRWHKLRAKVFRHVAKADPDHRYEAEALAGIDERAAAKLAAGQTPAT